MELTYRWIPRDTAGLWPIDLRDDLRSGRFDVMILGDLHSEALGREQLTQVALLVGQGTALLTLGGEHTYGAGGYAESPLRDVLPIRMNDSIRQRTGDLFETSAIAEGQISSPVNLIPKRAHPILEVAKNSGNSLAELSSAWKSVPEMPGANRWNGVRVAPGVDVLLTDQAKQPMMVVGEFGQGRVASLAFDSTWLWWRNGQDEFHRRFWRQLMLWLLSREESLEDEMDLRLDRRRIVGTLPTGFEASWVSPPMGGSPVAEIRTQAGEVIELESDLIRSQIAGNPGDSSPQKARFRLTGQIATEDQALPPGIHQLVIRTAEAESPSKDYPDMKDSNLASLSFEVVDDTRELSAAVPNHDLLRRIADLTSISGRPVFSS